MGIVRFRDEWTGSNIANGKIQIDMPDDPGQSTFDDPHSSYWITLTEWLESNITSIIDLDDTPDTYVGQQYKLFRVNAEETETEFVDPATVFAGLIHSATEKTPITDTDEIGFWDNVSGLLRKITWANLKDTFTTSLRPTTEKTALVNADEITGNDSENSFSQIRTTWTNVKVFLKAYFDGLYQTLSNLRTSWQVTPDDTHYPSEKLTKDSLDLKANLSGADFTGIVTAKNITGLSSTATSAGTLTMDVNSNKVQIFTGSTTHIVILPNATTLTTGRPFIIINDSSGQVTVKVPTNSSVLHVLRSGENIEVICKVVSSDDLSSWEVMNFGVERLQVAVGGLGADISIGTNIAHFTIPDVHVLLAYYISVKTAPTGSSQIFDVNVSLSTTMTTNKIEIEQTETSSLTATTQPVITNTNIIAKGAYYDVDCDQHGATIKAKDAFLVIFYRKLTDYIQYGG